MLTTIGYCDVYPVTVLGKVCGAVVAVLDLGFVALPSAILVGGIMEETQRRKEAARQVANGGERQCPHCGGSLPG
jgi:voltage-gated potassium channel